MTPVEENTALTRTGPGTPMGDVLRRYWLPALLAEELPEADCPPVRVKLLGERLIAFRDTQNRLRLMDEFCAHRGVPVLIGGNEDVGLRLRVHCWADICTRRNVGEDRYFWRVTQFLMPCFNLFPPYGDNPCGGHAWVPRDDENCWVFNIDYHPRRALNDAELQGAKQGRGVHVPLIDGS